MPHNRSVDSDTVTLSVRFLPPHWPHLAENRPQQSTHQHRNKTQDHNHVDLANKVVNRSRYHSTLSTKPSCTLT